MNQGSRQWYLCYHNYKLPATTYVHLDDLQGVHDSTCDSLTEEPPNANSTLSNPRVCSETEPCIGNAFYVLNHSEKGKSKKISSKCNVSDSCSAAGCAHDVGHFSHIPRTPPSQATFTLPSVMEKTVVTINNDDEGMFGMIKLRDNDVCYTSGTIEWVGRKRSYPINSGFKVMPEQVDDHHQSHGKMRKLNIRYTRDIDKLKDCDCADVLPTVNAIVDHLNALHEAVDLIDLRLNTIEDVTCKTNVT